MYDVALFLGLSLLLIGGLLVMATRRRRSLPQDEVNRQFQEIVRRLGD
jgi:LPXTG-motif cell wall-anchored protein